MDEQAQSQSARARTIGALLFVLSACVGLYWILTGRSDPTEETPYAAQLASPQASTEPEVVEEPLPEPTVPRALDWRDKPEFVVTEGTVGQRTVMEALARAGLGRNEIARLIAAFGKRLDRCRPKDTFVIVRKKADRELVLFEYVAGVSEVWQAEKSDDVWRAKKLELPVTTRKRARWVVVGRDLSSSLTAAGFEPELVKKLAEAFDGHVDLSQTKGGSLLGFVVREKRIDGRFFGYEEVEIAEVTTNIGPVRIYAFDFGSKDKPEHGYFDAKARQPAHGGWRMPIPFARVTSRYDPKRLHPVLKVVKPHNGVDFAGSVGTPVYAIGAGKVSYVANSGACGNMVQIQHAGGLESSYCHLSRFAAGLHVGDGVQGHDLIGYVGATGRVTGPHLHFAVKRNGAFIDPMSLQIGGFRVVAPSARPRYFEHIKELDAQLDALPRPAPRSGSIEDGTARWGEAEAEPEPTFEDEGEE